MVAIVTGNALGLSTSSLSVLGQKGASGSAAVGRNGDMAYVNAATGNLVLQTQDELLVGRGLSIESLRTYNSRGLFNDDNGDNWSMGVYAQQLKFEDPYFNGIGRFVRTDRDGAQAIYTTSTGQYYESKDGGGAFDRIYVNATNWTWVDGSTGIVETYDKNTGRLLSIADKSGNTLTYGYDSAGRLISVVDANNEATYYDYVGSELRQVRTGIYKNSQFVSQTRVRYEYDNNRLWKVTVDLTPEDGSVSDGKTFVTTYGYDGSSKRVASIKHNNDTVLRVQYDGSGRVQYVYDAFDKRTEYRYETPSRTRVIDPLNAETVYDYFATGDLKSVSSMAGGSVLETVSYLYDTNTLGGYGDLVRITDGQNNATDFSYDSLGNRCWERDAAGNTIFRNFNASGQVVSETVYYEPYAISSYYPARDTFATKRYIYDDAGLNRLRFVISPEGRITEYRYDALGQRTVSLTYGTTVYPAYAMYPHSPMPTEQSMSALVSSIYTAASIRYDYQRIDMAYDARGQLKKTTTYSAIDLNTGEGVLNGSESVTQYVYDQSGRLLQTISPTNGSTLMAYDGLGRVIARTEANGTITLTNYVDASNIAEQTITQTGLKTTSVYDKAGRLVSVQQTDFAARGLGESKYAYDANGRLLMTTDPTGARHWMLYDDAGRKVADIDGNGSLIEYTYSRNGQLTRTATYSTAVSTAALVDGTGKPTAPALATLRPATNSADVYNWNAYDRAGRLVKTVNGEGAVTETFYDGAHRIVKVTQYATRIATAGLGVAPSSASIAPTLDAARDRTTRYFYDGDGLLRGELDAEGYVVEYRYNAAGQRNWTLRYTRQVDSYYRTVGNFYQVVEYTDYLKSPRSATINFYNAKGQLAAEVDAENYLTEFEYDKNGNVQRKMRYSKALIGTVTPTTSLSSAKFQWQYQQGAMPDSQVTTWQYDEFHRVTLMTEPDGTVTKYDYDAVGNLVRTTRAYGQGIEERALNARYDAQGRLVAELAATEAWRLTTGMTDAQMAAVFEQYGVKHGYDKAGRRTSTTDRNGLTTLYFYNEDSQLTHTVNAMGEVEERRYNALNQLEVTLHYGLRLDSTARTQLRSGTTSIASAVAAIADASKDAKTTYAYKLSGLVASTTQQLKPGSQAVVQYLYNAFGGELERRTDLGDGTGRVRVDQTDYDRRGLRTRSISDFDGRSATVDVSYQYDAFGRLVRTNTNGGAFSEVGYDKLGRVVSTWDRHGFQYERRTTYDAFDRVLTQTDALGKVTTYVHNTAARSVTMTTPESVKVTTVYNRHGQTLSITDDKLQTTSYTYDKDGNLTRTTAPIASASTNQTFERGRLIEAFDANDTKVKYTYDDANRVLSREVDPDGLKLRTTYEYDSSGRQIKVTDPAGVVTRFEYDLAGRQVAQTVDEGAGRLNLRTEYTHDASGHVLTVTSPGNRVTQYKYDALGRRTEEIVDPAGLNLRTVYTFDHDGNVRTRTDAKGAVSGFAYDQEGWLQYSVDGAGGVTYYEYDKMGRVTRTTRYAEAISIAGLTAQFTSADIAARVVKKPGKDAVEARSYDGDGRLRFTADGNGAVVEYRYDKNNNVTERIAYAKAINVAAWTSGNPPVVTTASDQRQRNEYDALNRLTYQADATGAVTRREYDDNGNLRRLTEYATKLTGSQTPGQVTGHAGDRVTVFVYDKANRETWRVDATGAAQQSEYDNDGNLIARTSYFTAITAGTEPTKVALHADDRIERYTYDGAGRRTFSVDAKNFVTRWTYDDTQGRRTVTRFATPIPTGGNPADVARNAALDQTDVYLEDKVGRVVSHTDAEGETESWAYDAVGNKETFTNKKGSVWRYEYDAAGRLTLETSPEVYLTTVTASVLGGKLEQGASADAALKTRFKYDALGNLEWRTEAEGLPEARTTSYEYDARGRQIKVTYPPVLLYGEATEKSLTAQTFYDALGNAVANIDVAGRTSYKVYDLAGRVRYEVDTVGHVTGYERNTFGEAEKVTRYAVPTDLPTQTTAAAVALMPSADAVDKVEGALRTLDHSHDRSISNSYDKLGRVTEVREGTFYTFDSVSRTSTLDAKKTSHTYNAFGDLVKTRVSGANASTAIDTYFYYDRLGRQVAQVDALGYVTVREFDAAGNMTASTEYAGKLGDGAWNAVAHGLPLPSADDRKTTWTYDRLNRKTTETRLDVSFAASAAAIPAGQQPAAANIVTEYSYDAVGNLTRTLDANDGETLSYYDALGRVTAVVSPTTQGVNGLVKPLTVFLRDAYGNVVVKWDLANGAAEAEEFTEVSRESKPGFTLGAADEKKDRRTVTRYDRMGRAIQTTDAEGNSQFTAYRANGQVGKTWQFVTDIDGQRGKIYQIFEYDELGRLVATREPSPTNVLGMEAGETRLLSVSESGEVFYSTAGDDTLTRVEYNAFGEITERKVNGEVVEYFKYDDVGLLWLTNSGDGVARVLFYDVHGRKTAEVRSRGADFGEVTGPDYRGVDLKTFASAADVKDAVVANDERLSYTLTEYDALGRVTKQTQPLRTEGGELDRVQMKSQSGATVELDPPIAAGATVRFKNVARLTWPSLASLGAGEVRVELTYKSVLSDGGLESKEVKPRTNTRSQVFSADQSVNGVDFGWNEPSETLEEVENFNVWKKDAAGVYRLILDRALGAKRYSVEVALPPDPAVSVRFETKVGDGNWIRQTSGIRFGSVLRFDMAQLGSRSFSYRVFYDRLDAQTGAVTEKTDPDTTGEFTITGAPVLQPISLEGGFQMPGVAKGVLAWTKPPAGTTQVLNYRTIGGQWRFVDTVYEVSDTLSGANAAILPDGEYEYELLWTPPGELLPTSHATGTFTVAAAVDERQTSGTPNITGIVVGATAVSWDTRIDSKSIAGTPRFEWRSLDAQRRTVGGMTDWKSITEITIANNRASVDIRDLAGGAHEFRISYVLNGEKTALGTLTASLGEPDVKDAPEPVISNRLTVPASNFWVNPAGNTLNWVNTGTNSKFEYRERAADGQPGSGAWIALATTRVGTSGSVDISGLAGGKKYEFRITSEEAENATVTIGAGNLTTYVTGGGIPQPPQVSSTSPSGLTGLQVAGQELTWNEIAGTSVKVEGRYKGTHVWESLDALMLPISGGKLRVNMGGVNPGDYEVRISHYSGESLVAFEARGVEVFPNPSAAPFFVDLTSGHAVEKFTLADGKMTWARPAFAAPGTARFVFSDANDPNDPPHVREVVSTGAADSISLAGLPAAMHFKVTYEEGGVVTGGGAGTTVPDGPTDVVGVTVGGIRVSDGRLRWNAPGTEQTTRVFRRVDGVFTRLPDSDLTLADGKYSIKIPARTTEFASYEYLIQYCDKNGQEIAVGAARVEMSPANVRGDHVLFVPHDAGITNLTADHLKVSWDVRPGTPKVEARLLGSGSAWEVLDVLARDPGSNRESVRIAGGNGKFEWRITYTDPEASGGVLAMASGTLDITTPQPVLSNLTSSQLSSISVAPGRIQWLTPVGTTRQSIKVQNPENGAWDELPATYLSTEGNLQIVDLSHTGAGPSQVHITYFNGSEVTHVMRGTVTTFLPGSASARDLAVAVFPPTSSDFSWTDVPGVGTPFFQYRLRTDANGPWRGDLPVGAPVDGKRHVDISSLDGNYEYRVSYTSGSLVTALATGQLDIVRPKPQLSATDGAVLKNMSANATRWSWDRPAGDVIGTVKFRALGGTWSVPAPLKVDGARDYVDAVDAPIGTFEYAITYTELGIETSFSTGVVVVNPPQLVSADRADIQGVTHGPSSLSWTPHANSAATAKFAYRGSSNLTGSWTELAVQVVDGKAKVDLAGLHGSYDYRISYELDKEVVALDAGRINITTTAPTVLAQGASRLQGITATASQVKWVAQEGTLKVEYRATGSNVVEVMPDFVLARGVGGFDAVDLSRIGPIGGLFRITYTNSAGLITAMAIGEITGPGWSSPVPNATANVTGLTVTSTTLSWTSTHTGTPRFYYRVNGGAWLDGPQPTGSSVDITGVANTSAVYEYRIVYSDGAGMTALGMGRLTVSAATAALGSNAGGQVGGFYADRRQVSWATPAGAVGAPVVFVRQPGYSGWEGPMPLLGQNAVDLSYFGGSGTWEIRVAYRNGGELTHLGTASFVLASPTVSAQTSSDIMGIAGEPGPRLAWNAMPGTPVLEYLDVASGTWLSASAAGVGTLFANDGTGRAGFNFIVLPPSNYSFRITYQLNGDTKGFASGQIYFNGDTSAPGVQTNNTAFGASITATLGKLHWTPPPGTSAGQGAVIYRVPGGSWTSAGAVQTLGSSHFVDISSIAAGTYEFRIHYASGATILGGATPTVQIHGSPGLINPDIASLGSFTLGGTQLSWTAPAAGGTPVFEYHNGSNWVAGPTVGTLNGRPSVNVQDIYGVPVNFRVRYTSFGHDVAFGSGSFNATRATLEPAVLPSEVSGYRIEFGKLLWNRPASAVGTATFSRRPSSGGGWQSVAANESFDLSVLGSGSWDYRVTYSSNGVETSFGSGTLVVPTSVMVPVSTRADIGPVTAPPNGTTLEWAPSVYPEAVATFKAFSNGQWVPKAVSTVNDKHSASVLGLGGGTMPFRIEYTIGDMVVGLVTGSFSVGSTGTPVILNSTRGEVEGVSMVGTTLSWTRPSEVNGTAKVYLRRAGDTGWQERGVSGETANLSDILNNHYGFRIEYTDANGQVVATAVGTLQPQSVQVLATATTNVGGFQATRTRLSWDKPALSGVTEHFEYYEPTTLGLLSRPVIDDVGGRRAIDVTGLEGVGYRYRVVYRDAVTGDIRALGTGIFRIGSQTPPVLTSVVSTISQPELRAGRLVWERPPSVPAGSTALFERKLSNGSWYGYDIPVTAQDGTHDRIDLSKLSAGTHEWRVKYTAPSGVVMAVGAGTVEVPQTVQLSNQTLGNVSGIRSDTRWLSWDPLDTATFGEVKAEVYNASTGQWDAYEPNAIKYFDGRPHVEIAGVVGSHEFRISYGKTIDGQRHVMALARGQFTGALGTISHTVTASPVGDFLVNGDELSWTPVAGAVEVHRQREGTTTWEPISPVNSNGSRHSLVIGDIEAGNHQYRVTYKEGGVVTAMASVGVTIDVGVVVERRPAEVKAETRKITDFTVPAQTHDIRWTRSPDGGTPVFEYRSHGTLDWQAAPVGSFGALDGVDVRSLNLRRGSYEFRVQYRSGQGHETFVSANGAGNFTIPVPLPGTQTPTVQLNSTPTVLGNFAGTIRSVTWDAPPDSSGLRAYAETRLVDGTEWAPVNITRGGAKDGTSFNPVYAESAYEFRVTYTDAAGAVAAIGAGVVKFGNGTYFRKTEATVAITTPPYVPGRKAADAKYELTPTTDSNPHALSDPRLGFTASHTPGAKPGAYALQPKIMQKLDRWGNVVETTDPRNAAWKTTYKWNWANQLVEQVRPVDGAAGGSPTTRIYYDALGRQVGMQDANGNLNTKTYDLAGNLVEEGQADGGRITHSYDALGNKVQTTDAVGNEAQRTDTSKWAASELETVEQAKARHDGRTTDFVYDRMGRLVKAVHGPVEVYSMTVGPEQYSKLTLSAPDWRRVTETFTYDEAGRKKSQTDGNYNANSDPDGKVREALMTSYKYDAAGHIVEVRQPKGVKTSFTYDVYGFKNSEADANGNTQSWVNDAQGRVLSHTDMADVRVDYTYDNAKLLQSMKARDPGVQHTDGTLVPVPRQDQEFKYDQAGQLIEVVDKGVGRTTTYQYDAAGNHVLERTEQVVDGKKLLLQDNHLGYDAQGRLRQIFDGHLSIAIDYDLNGNREKITTTISVLSAAGAGQETSHDSVRNFAYDNMNRQTVVEEYDERLPMVRHTITYNLDGTRKTDSFHGNRVGSPPIVNSYSYDNLGRLVSVARDGTQVDLRRYDGVGRALQSGSPGNLPADYVKSINQAVPSSEQIGADQRFSAYDENGRLLLQNVHGSDGKFKQSIDYRGSYRANGLGYDEAGNLKGYRLNIAGSGFVETHRFQHARFDGYVVASETVTDKNDSNPVYGTTEYDANGHQKRIVDGGMTANNRNIYSDAAGRALLVDQGGNLHRQLIVNGEVLGSYGIGLDELTPKDKDKKPVFAPHVDFEWGYQQINGHYPGASPGAYTVRQGDTLQGIARGAYGDSRMWYRIAEANGLSSDSDLKVGQTLTIPTGVGVHNASDTFEPYDPSKVVGDTSPTLPVPAAKKGCGGIGQIIMIVVAIVATVFTAGAAALAMAGTLGSAGFGTIMAAGASAMIGGGAVAGGIAVGSMAGVGFGGAMAAAAIGGAVGSIVSQGVGIAIGAQEKFSWKQVGMSAIGSGVGAGIGGSSVGAAVSGFAGGGATGAMAVAAVSNAATQGVAVAVGLQDKFQWKSVAASAVAAGVGQAVGSTFNNAFGNFGGQFATGLVKGVAAAAVRGGKISVKNIAVDAFGNALGNGIVDSMQTQNTAQESFRQGEIRDQNTEAARYQGQGLFSGSSVRLGNSGSGRAWLGSGDNGDRFANDLPELPEGSSGAEDWQPRGGMRNVSFRDGPMGPPTDADGFRLKRLGRPVESRASGPGLRLPGEFSGVRLGWGAIDSLGQPLGGRSDIQSRYAPSLGWKELGDYLNPVPRLRSFVDGFSLKGAWEGFTDFIAHPIDSLQRGGQAMQDRTREYVLAGRRGDFEAAARFEGQLAGEQAAGLVLGYGIGRGLGLSVRGFNAMGGIASDLVSSSLAPYTGLRLGVRYAPYVPGPDDIAQFSRYTAELRSLSEPRNYLAEFTLRRGDDGSISYSVGSLRKEHGLDATLSPQGSLSIEVQATNPKLRATLGSGTDMYNDMIRRIGGPDNIRQIEGVWSRSSGLTSNLDSFEANYALTRDKYAAAAQTWSGKRAASYGFHPRDVQITSDGVRVVFGRR